MDIIELDQVIHQPIRTKIITYLILQGECDFSTLKKVLSLSDGHMSNHMAQLIDCGYVETKKEFIDN